MANNFIDSLEAFQSILEYAIEGILVVDIKTRRIKYANPAMCKMFGYSPEEFTGFSVSDIHPAEHSQTVLEQFDALARGEIELADEIHCKRKNGTVFLADISSSRIIINGIACNVGFFTDVTKRKQADEAILKSEKQFRSLFMSMTDGFYLSEILYDDHGNPCDYKYLEVNPKFEQIAGLSRDQIIGKRYKEIVPVDTTLWLDVYFTVARTGIPESYEFYSEEYQMYFETYSYRPAMGQVSVIVRNVTERKRMDEALQKAQRLESLGVLAGGIAHDFNNLLTGIFGYVDLARFASKDARISGFLDSTLSSMNRARALTLQLLTFAKGGAPVQKLTPLFPFIQETAQFALSGSNVSCTFLPADDLNSCNIDKNQIGQVIDNIVINAQQAMPGGGTIEISAINLSLGNREHPRLSKGDYVKVSIKDYGIGIPKEIMPRIFDPFFTTKTKGHGLGLATCYSIIKRHGGCIDVESEPGKGSTFHLYLPASSETITVETVSATPHKGCGAVLVVDDEEVLRDLFQKMLESQGYTVVCKNNGRQAIDFFISETRDERKFAAMIFDLTIPGGMGGMEAVAEIRKLDKKIPIFVSSGYADNSVMKNPALHGFTASISKPFTMAELSEMLNRHMKPE
jgi:PAS domain S-box-containing protein